VNVKDFIPNVTLESWVDFSKEMLTTVIPLCYHFSSILSVGYSFSFLFFIFNNISLGKSIHNAGWKLFSIL
jgi:hypothetical protein